MVRADGVYPPPPLPHPPTASRRAPPSPQNGRGLFAARPSSTPSHLGRGRGPRPEAACGVERADRPSTAHCAPAKAGALAARLLPSQEHAKVATVIPDLIRPSLSPKWERGFCECYSHASAALQPRDK